MNANVRKPIHEVFGENLKGYKNVFFIEPLRYLTFVYPMEKSTVMLTDSGGIQKAMNIPARRWHTVKALESGTVILEVKDGRYEPLKD